MALITDLTDDDIRTEWPTRAEAMADDDATDADGADGDSTDATDGDADDDAADGDSDGTDA